MRLCAERGGGAVWVVELFNALQTFDRSLVQPEAHGAGVVPAKELRAPREFCINVSPYGIDSNSFGS